MEYERQLEHWVIQLARLGLRAESKDIELLVRRLARRYKLTSPRLSSELRLLLEEYPTQLSPLREVFGAAPAPAGEGDGT